MAPVKNTKVLLVKSPETYFTPGEHTKVVDEEIDLETVPLNGGYLTKTLIRSRMHDGGESYMPEFKKNEPIENFGVSVVVRSEIDKVRKGDHLYGMYPFESYTVWPAAAASNFKVLENKERLPWSIYVGLAGMPGKTAWYGLDLYAGELKAGETIYVNAAAGPVGAFVIQRAKVAGMYVIASAGSEEKCKFVKELGADFVFNCKQEKEPLQALEESGKRLDVYWENVGGAHFEAALEKANKFAHFIVCGFIVDYNVKKEDRYPIRGLTEIFAKEIKISGFIVGSVETEEENERFYSTVPKWIAEGKMKVLEHITHGIENADKALLNIYKGLNLGKAVVRVAD